MDPPGSPPIASGSFISPKVTDTDSAWPRRTSKACANRRRDKVRCDGARPCSGCAKKQLQCLDGCNPCRRARARCEKTGARCTRCEEKNIECDEEPPVPSFVRRASPPGAAPYLGDRVKLACQSCRNDNKKCDNQRPCARCVARSETCVHVLRGPKQTKLRCEGCRKQNVRCEDARPCQNCVDAGTECVNLTRQGRVCGTRTKAACTNCRRNKIRCDGGRPCGSCSRKGSDCVEQPPRRGAQNDPQNADAVLEHIPVDQPVQSSAPSQLLGVPPHDHPPPTNATMSNQIYPPDSATQKISL
ncbi:hypothetical protein B0H10DRAFT_1912446 [Mycena sp. CBHHK59/15]|nr:hypothetical protein B0H10DRAFT_1912446 [Mycena sp. CBHHK59/15]